MNGLRRRLFGAAAVEPVDRGVRLTVRRGDPQRYSNAQLDDYAGLPRGRFPHAPPLTLALSARFSHEAAAAGGPGLRGTSGFGFWNDPWLMTERRRPTLPRAAWFFYASPPSDMKLDLATPGWGWKAATLDALRPAAIGPALAAPLLIPLMNAAPLYRRAWPQVQARLRIGEALVPGSMTDWRRYAIEWGTRRVRFRVDDALVLDAPAPHGPLGLVIWCDNQYLIVRPWGRAGWGLLDAGEQWLEVADISITPHVGEGNDR